MMMMMMMDPDKTRQQVVMLVLVESRGLVAGEDVVDHGGLRVGGIGRTIGFELYVMEICEFSVRFLLGVGGKYVFKRMN
jgi:hypothetical protein